MQVFNSSDIRNVAFIGHKAAGKTSLAEAALRTAGVTNRLGSTAEGTSVLDYEDEERKRVMSTATSIASLEWQKTKINLLDTPGDTNFLKDSQLALQAVEGAVCVISAKSGVEPMTERVYGWSKELGLTRAFFISKMDAENADFQTALDDLKNNLEAGATAVQFPLGGGPDFKGIVDLLTLKAYAFEDGDAGTAAEIEIPADLADEVEHARNTLIEDIAENDELLMEKFFEDVLTPEDIVSGLAKSMAAGLIIPVLCGSGTQNQGLPQLLDMLVASIPNPVARPPRFGWIGESVETRALSPEGPTTCFCFKTIVDQHSGRINVLRVFAGEVSSNTTLHNTSRGDDGERIGALHGLLGKTLTSMERAPTGDIFAAQKLKSVHTGDTLSADSFRLRTVQPAPPLISRAIVADDHGADDKIAAALQRLVEEDPGLSLDRDPATGQLLLAGTGQQHIEVAIEKMQRKFGVEAGLALPRIPYLETFTAPVKGIEGKHKKQSGGSGQFGVIYVDIEPAERGEGLVFEDAVTGGSVPRQFIPAVEKGFHKAMSRGLIAGYPVVDVKVRLYDGKHHPVDSKEVAFQLAAAKAFKAAAEAARPVILEPIMNVEITVPEENMGDIIGDVSTRRGRVNGSAPSGRYVVINALIPLAEIQEYEATLRSMTHGRGAFVMEQSHMEAVPASVQAQIVKASGFVVSEDDE